MSEALLEVANLVKHFPVGGGLLRAAPGMVRAVDGVSFTLRRGETLGPGGRVGLRQDHDRPLHPAARAADQRAASLFEGADLTTLRRGRAAHGAPPHAGDLPGPLHLAQPAHDRRPDHRRAAQGARHRARTRAARDDARARAARRRSGCCRSTRSAIRTSSRAASASASASRARWRWSRRSSSATSRCRRSTCRSRRRSSTCSRTCRARSASPISSSRTTSRWCATSRTAWR